jgi:hypothetical protein
MRRPRHGPAHAGRTGALLSEAGDSERSARDDAHQATGDRARIAALERAVAELQRELASLRAAPAGAPRAPLPYPERVVPASPPPGPAGAGRPAARASMSLDRRVGVWAARLGVGRLPSDGAELEAVVGRYGTVVLAGLLILMGLGAFLTWAIAEVTLTPATRVALGAIGAGVLGLAGWRMRGGLAGSGVAGSRRFGDVLLALALAAVHVDAWGAGPALGLLSATAALGIAALASAALALLAWRERDQALFVVGVGGALVAPFVTGVDVGSREVLAVYGWLVLSAGVVALPRPPLPDPSAGRSARWAIAARMLGLGGAAYAAALLQDATVATGVGNPAGVWLPRWQLRRDLPALFALACAAVPLVAPGRVRRAGVALLHLSTALVALVTLGLTTSGGAPALAGYAFVAALGAQSAAWRLAPQHRAPGRAARRDVLVGALALPLALLAAALIAVPEAASPAGASIAGAWALASSLWALAFARTRTPVPTLESSTAAPSQLGAHVAAAGLSSAMIPVLLLTEHAIARLLALALHAAGFALLLGRVRQRAAALPSLASIGVAAASVVALLRERPAFAYTPFLTPASLAALAVIGALGVLAWRVRRDAAGSFSTGERTALVALVAIAALLWGREELARAGSPEIATFLLVGYFAAAGCAALAVGRARQVAGARQVGLALAIYAALKALAQASELRAVGLRVGSYLLVGAFLLAVGYWYRSAGDRPDPAPDAEPALP